MKADSQTTPPCQGTPKGDFRRDRLLGNRRLQLLPPPPFSCYSDCPRDGPGAVASWVKRWGCTPLGPSGVGGRVRA
jgi:hypothetical protein